MRKVKQMLIVRKDLNMRTGKIAAQCSHAVLGLALKYKLRFLFSWFNPMGPTYLWLRHKFTKICVYVNSEKELFDKLDMIKTMYPKMPYRLIRDAGHTEFHGVPTYTCMAIGPWWSDELDYITGDLKLL